MSTTKYSDDYPEIRVNDNKKVSIKSLVPCLFIIPSVDGLIQNPVRYLLNGELSEI